jgi:hypothetical protein
VKNTRLTLGKFLKMISLKMKMLLLKKEKIIYLKIILLMTLYLLQNSTYTLTLLLKILKKKISSKY